MNSALTCYQLTQTLVLYGHKIAILGGCYESLLVGQEKIAEMLAGTTLHQTTQLGLLDGSFYPVLELHSGSLNIFSQCLFSSGSTLNNLCSYKLH